MEKIPELEAKIHEAVEMLAVLHQENARLRKECDSLKSHLALLDGENGKAQKVLSDYEQLKKSRDQITHRVERALNTLNGLRSGVKVPA